MTPPFIVNGQPFSIHQSNAGPSSPRSCLSEPHAPFFPFIQQSTTLFLNRFDMSCNITFGQLTSGPHFLVSLDCLVLHSLSQAQARCISLVFLTDSDSFIVLLVCVVILTGAVTWPRCPSPKLPLFLIPCVLHLAITLCFRQSTPFHLGHFDYLLPISLFAPHKLST